MTYQIELYFIPPFDFLNRTVIVEHDSKDDAFFSVLETLVEKEMKYLSKTEIKET